MPFPGTVWATGTWAEDAWAADTWADATVITVTKIIVKEVLLPHFKLRTITPEPIFWNLTSEDIKRSLKV